MSSGNYVEVHVEDSMAHAHTFGMNSMEAIPSPPKDPMAYVHTFAVGGFLILSFILAIVFFFAC
jgi:hypothetical protein